MHNTFLCIALVLAFGCVSCVSSLKGTGVCPFLQWFLSFIYNYCDTVYVLFYSQYYCTYLAHASPSLYIHTYLPTNGVFYRGCRFTITALRYFNIIVKTMLIEFGIFC